MDEREGNVPEMTNEEYRNKINDILKRIDDIEFLNFIYNFINSAIKKWL